MRVHQEAWDRLIIVPALMIVGDGGKIRDSVSAYYNMEQNQLYYVSLTVASMLFIVNGVVKRRHVYNTFLGLFLGGVILFNYRDYEALHFVFATAFFAGNVVAIALFTPKREQWLKILMALGIVVSLLSSLFVEWLNLFWAEWISMAIISLHYLLESMDCSGHQNKRR